MKDCLRYKSSELNPVLMINSLLISIVLYLHYTNYTNDYFSILIDYHINELLQKFAVGGFFFFSGLKLSISHLDYDIISFAKNRFIRIYGLYFIALIIASFTSYPFLHNGVYPTVTNFILHALCVNTIFPDQNYFHTVWFVSILFVCYGLFIFLRKDIVDIKKFLPKQITIIFLISVVYLYTSEKPFKMFTRDFSIYLLFFSIGMLASRYSINLRNKYYYVATGFIGNLVLLAIYNGIYIDLPYGYIIEYVIYVFLVIVSNVALFQLLGWFVKETNLSDRVRKMISIYSYASFCVFLLQRSIWSVMASIYPKGTLLQWLFIVLLGIPVIVFCSYYLQHYYDLLLQNYTATGAIRRRNTAA